MDKKRSLHSAVESVLHHVREVLWDKNKRYGNSAIDPLRIFSQADPLEQIRVRIDDKLSRIARGGSVGEDTVTDLIGYLVLLKAGAMFYEESEPPK